MWPLHRLCAVVFLVLLQASALAAGSRQSGLKVSVERFRPGERVVFFGDSITHGGSYVFYAQLYWDLRYPGSQVVLMNGGISGDTAGGAIRRWAQDIVPMKPDRVFVMFGMNDVGRNNYASLTPGKGEQDRRRGSLVRYEENQRKLAALIRQAGVGLVMVTPSPYDQYGTRTKVQNYVACNEPGLLDCAGIVRKVAEENKLGLVEFHAPMTELLKAHPEAMLCGPDRVHPRNVGHLLMAALMLERLERDSAGELKPMAFSWLDVSAGTVMVKNGYRAEIGQVKGGRKGLAFDYRPQGLPFPALREYLTLEKLYPQITQQLNREILRVTGLEEGTYVLKADGRVVGHFTAAELGGGVNVALLDTPNQRQAKKAAESMYKLRSLESHLQNLPYMNRLLQGRKVNLDDQEACFRGLDDWLKELIKRGSNGAGYVRNVINDYKKLRPQEPELRKKALSLRETLRAACVPLTCRITVEKP